MKLILLEICLFILYISLCDSHYESEGECNYNPECDCGSIAKPVRAETFTIKVSKNDSLKYEQIDADDGAYEHNSRVWYQCIDPNDYLVGNHSRVCKNGKWIGKVPRCGKYLLCI